jgi:hypothetical protein
MDYTGNAGRHCTDHDVMYIRIVPMDRNHYQALNTDRIFELPRAHLLSHRSSSPVYLCSFGTKPFSVWRLFVSCHSGVSLAHTTYNGSLVRYLKSTGFWGIDRMGSGSFLLVRFRTHYPAHISIPPNSRCSRQCSS